MMTHGSLFTGIGGIDLGFEWAGIETRWQVEIDDYCQKLLSIRFPHTKKFTDVRKVGSHNLEKVDIISGGFPCQDISVAGKGAGIEGERSGLWTELHRVISELRPRFAFIENVPMLTIRGGGELLATLPKSGMMQNGKLWEQTTLVRGTGEKGSGLWPTFPTPTVQDGENDGGPSQYKRNSIPLNAVVKEPSQPTGQLNPTWVEWLMGYPSGWTDLKVSETQLCRTSPISSERDCMNYAKKTKPKNISPKP